MKRFRIYWGNGKVSCFQLHSIEQALSIAKQYKNVERVEEVK